MLEKRSTPAWAVLTFVAMLAFFACVSRAASAAVDCDSQAKRLGAATNAMLDRAQQLEDDAQKTADRSKFLASEKAFTAVIADARAKQLDPACVSDLLNGVAYVEMQIGRNDAALRDEETANATLDPDASPAERAEKLSALSVALASVNRLDEASVAGRKAQALLATIASPDAQDVFAVNYGLGTLMMRTGAYDESARDYTAAAKVLDPSNRFGTIARVLAAAALRSAGHTADADRAIDAEVAAAPPGPLQSFVLLWRSQFRMQDDRFKEAERDLLMVVDADPNADPSAMPMRGAAESELGYLYMNENRVADAGAAFERSADAFRSVRGAFSAIGLASAYESQALVFTRFGQYDAARSALAKAEHLAQRESGQTGLLVGGVSIVAAIFSLEDGTAALDAHEFSAAESALTEAATEMRRVGVKGNYLATAETNLSIVERFEGRCGSAREHLNAAERALTAGPSSLVRSQLDFTKAVLDHDCGATAAAAEDYSAAFGDLKEQYASTFSLLGERERLAFVGGTQEVFDGYFSFGLDANDPNLGSALYDVALFRKNLVARTEAALQARVRRSNDPAVTQTFDTLIATKKELATLADFSTSPDRIARASELAKRSETLQSQLAERFPDLADALLRGAPHTGDVRAALHPDEAAVEIVRFRRFASRDTTGPPWYAALVLRGDRTQPTIVDLGPASAIEGDALLAYRLNGVPPPQRRTPADAGPLARLVWLPLAPALSGMRTVYVAPDGVLNTVAFDAFRSADSDGLRVVLVDTTEDIASRAAGDVGAKSALLFGDPRFDLSVADQRAQLHGVAGSPAVAARSHLADPLLVSMRAVSNGQPLPELDGTATEVMSVKRLLDQHGWTSQSYTGAAALEETLESQAHGQRVVHLATHGVFLPDVDVPAPAAGVFPQGAGAAAQTSGTPSGPNGPSPLPDALVGAPQNDPMLRSLLFFAGADRVWAAQQVPPDDLDSGVLTAAEASTLDLRGTELVVLSACDTGLGSLRSGDGVLGLRRALRQAGARQVLMSLWRLPDRETQELMTAFYAHWLGGADAHDALRAAQRDEQPILMKRYGNADPYYWAGLIVVGAPAVAQR